ncbi:MAG: dienelactone hydrolase family protein [Bacteroidales bacterium]|nr:dienelactone hydrolase family protein [Bacteroidales bacterium]
MRLIISLIISFCIAFSGFSQKKISFYASDSLKITADLYLKDYKLPFILLFHQGGASRGEYTEIAARLMKLDYNCLAVDLRSGGKMNYVINETAQRALEMTKKVEFADARKDILASINYIRKFNKKPVILFGSSYSASLCLIVASETPDVKAVVALSPGEYFRPELIVKDEISDINVPVFISSTSLEYEYIIQMISPIPSENVSIFRPGKGRGSHGAKMLWQESDSSDECWLELLMFFKKIRYT